MHHAWLSYTYCTEIKWTKLFVLWFFFSYLFWVSLIVNESKLGFDV